MSERAHRRPRRAILRAATLAAAATALPAEGADSPRLRLTEIHNKLAHPWSLAFLPDARMLVTERPGRLRVLSPDGTRAGTIDGVPPVHASGQGGLLDIALSPDFERDQTVFLSYAEPAPGGSRTAVLRARLAGDALRDAEVIFRQVPVYGGGALHYGSRIVFGRDGHLWITLGDRFRLRDQAQRLDSHLGKVVRIDRDGRAPPDNPFVSRPGALPEIWSIGHRNVQGAARHPVSGELWLHEHGPQGGDEINIARAGLNYGWPVITHGEEYGGGAIGEGTARPGMESPLLHWTPSIAPSGMAFYTAARVPQWRGSLFVGSLKFRMLVRVALSGQTVLGQQRLLTDLNRRVRDVRQGPDGWLYLLTDEDDGGVLRVSL